MKRVILLATIISLSIFRVSNLSALELLDVKEMKQIIGSHCETVGASCSFCWPTGRNCNQRTVPPGPLPGGLEGKACQLCFVKAEYKIYGSARLCAKEWQTTCPPGWLGQSKKKQDNTWYCDYNSIAECGYIYDCNDGLN